MGNKVEGNSVRVGQGSVSFRINIMNFYKALVVDDYKTALFPYCLTKEKTHTTKVGEMKLSYKLIYTFKRNNS